MSSGCNIEFRYSNYLDVKLEIFQYLCGTIKRPLLEKARQTILKFYKMIAVPTLRYESEYRTNYKLDNTNRSKRDEKHPTFSWMLDIKPAS